MKCPIFQIVRDYLMAQADFKSRCFLKETRTTDGVKQYYKILLPESRDVLMINNQILERREHHVSIYEDQTWSEKHYQSTYHYTGTFNSGLSQIIIHVYFNSDGQFCYIHVKDDKGARIDNISEADQINIRIYAESVSMQMISIIQSKAIEVSQELEQELNRDVTTLETISEQLKHENIEILDEYRFQLEQCLKHFEKLEKYTYFPQKSKQKIFTDAHEYITKKIEIMQHKVTIKEKIESDMNVESKELQHGVDDKIEKRAEKNNKLIMIDAELKNLSQIKDLNERLIKEYELQNDKITFSMDDDIDSYLPIINRINKLESVLRSRMLFSCSNGDTNAVKKLRKYANYIPPRIYFECVKKGYIEIAIFLITNYKYNINLINFVSEPGQARVDTFGSTLLFTAIYNRQYAMFKWLLENGANPNLINPIVGHTALMVAVIYDLEEYVKLLFSFKANPDLICFTQSVVIQVNNASSLSSPLKMGNHEQIGKTALHIACIGIQKNKMITMLLNNDANASLLDLEKFPPYFYLMINEQFPLDQAVMQNFIDKKINIDFQHPKSQITGLYFACEKNRLADVKFLVEHGANPNVPTDLIVNCFKMENPDQTNIFIKKLEDLLRGDHQMRATPLIAAVIRNFVGVVSYLLKQTQTPVTIDTIYNALTLTKLTSPHNTCVELLADKLQFLEKQSQEHNQVSRR